MLVKNITLYFNKLLFACLRDIFLQPVVIWSKMIFLGLPRIPNKPTIVSRSYDSITINWQRYQYSSDAEISKYIVIYRPQGGGTRKRDVSKSQTEYTLTGLFRNTEYNISILVVMKDGTEGLPSEYRLIRTCGCKYFRLIYRKILQGYHNIFFIVSMHNERMLGYVNRWKIPSVSSLSSSLSLNTRNLFYDYMMILSEPTGEKHQFYRELKISKLKSLMGHVIECLQLPKQLTVLLVIFFRPFYG